jgi:hypothetical protein
MSNYLETVSIELNKAYVYFEDIDNYIDKVETILYSGLLSQVKKEKNVNNALKIINEQKNSFNLEAERLFFIRILIDGFYQDKLRNLLPIIDKLISRLETEFEENIAELMVISLPKHLTFPSESYNNGLPWQIEEVLKPNKDSEGYSNEFKIESNNKSSNKIDWKKTQRTIVYLFYQLNQYGFIDEKQVYSLITKLFTSKGKEISRKQLFNNFNQADYLGLNKDELPPELKDIDSIIDRLIEFEKALKLLEKNR